MMPIPDNASFFGTCDSNGVFVNVSWENKHKVKAILFFNFTENLLTNVQLNLLSGEQNCKIINLFSLNSISDNTLFEQSKRVELRSTSNEITIEFENEHSLDFTFFEFSTHYHDSSLISSTESKWLLLNYSIQLNAFFLGFEVAPSSEELQRSTSLVVLQITIGCVGLVVVIAVAAFYAFKKYRGQRDNFKLNAETA